MAPAKEDSEMFQLKWSVHNAQMVREFYDLYQTGLYSDVTVATDDQSFPCHRLVLSACSPYFRALFQRTSCKNPVIVLKDISAGHFAQLIRYMYIGQIDVPKVDMEELLEHANYLKIRGLETPSAGTEETKHRKAAAAASTNAVRPSPVGKRRRSVFESIEEEEEFDQVERENQAAEALLQAAAAMEFSGRKNGLQAREGKSRKGYHPKKTIRYPLATASDDVPPTVGSWREASPPSSDPDPERVGARPETMVNNNPTAPEQEEQPMDYSKPSSEGSNKAGRLAILDNFLHRRTRRHTDDGIMDDSQTNAEELAREEFESKENKAASLDRYLHLLNGGKKNTSSPTMVPLQETLGIDITGRLRQHFLDTLPAQAAQWMQANQTAAAAGRTALSAASAGVGSVVGGVGGGANSNGRSTPEEEEEEDDYVPRTGKGRGRGGAHRSPASANIALDEFGNPRLGPNGKPMVRCETCNKELADPSSLYRHRKIHSGEKPHECPFCPRKFIQRYNMRQHLKTHKLKGVPAKLIERLEPDLQEVFLNNRF